jgi:hypothetical protein
VRPHLLDRVEAEPGRRRAHRSLTFSSPGR